MEVQVRETRTARPARSRRANARRRAGSTRPPRRARRRCAALAVRLEQVRERERGCVQRPAAPAPRLGIRRVARRPRSATRLVAGLERPQPLHHLGSRRCRRARRSTTTPPPIVSGGASCRRITRSPRAATSGASAAAGRTPRPSGETRAGDSRVPWCTWTRAARRERRGARLQLHARRRRCRPARTSPPAHHDVAARPPRAATPRPGSAPRAAPPPRARPARRAPAPSARAPRCPAGQDRDLVARAQRARPQRAGHDRADPLQRERAVDVQARGAVHGVAARRRRSRGRGRARRAARRARRPRSADTGTTSAPGTSSRRLRRRRRAGSADVGLRDRHHPVLHAELPQHRQVLARLRHHAVVGRDAQQEQVDAGRAGDHRAHEALVARHVDDRQRAPARQVERREAQLDRDPALALLGQAVGVLAR